MMRTGPWAGSKGTTMTRADMTNTRRQAGFSAFEFTASLALVAMVVFGADWVSGSADATAKSRETRSQALAIAQGQSTVAQSIAWDRLTPTADFAPASWVHQPGYAPGQVPVEIIGDEIDPDAGPDIYEVSVRITDLDRSGHMRRIEVRVGFDRANGDRGWVDLESVRAG